MYNLGLIRAWAAGLSFYERAANVATGSCRRGGIASLGEASLAIDSILEQS